MISYEIIFPQLNTETMYQFARMYLSGPVAINPEKRQN